MASLKATFDGIGTGGGVAWPLFGILFSTLGLAVGGTLTIIIGSTVGVLFLAVCLPVFYLSYKNSSKEEQALRAKLKEDREGLNKGMFSYLQSIFDEYLCALASIDDIEHEELLNYIIGKIGNDKLGVNSAFLNQLFTAMLTDKRILTKFVTDKISEKELALTMKPSRYRVTFSQKQTPRSLLVSAAFIGFVSTFGAVAGSSSGILGLLTGMSIFAGLAAFPILGWGILSAAVLVSFLVAGVFIYVANEKFQLRQEHSALKEVYQQLDNITSDRNKALNVERISKKIIDSIAKPEGSPPLNALIPQLLGEFSDSFFTPWHPKNPDIPMNIPAEQISGDSGNRL
ncbi:MAG: hypothetical protein Q8M03_00870 [Legionella sp.]|nr:hypothetical protein [Legionella sp.]